MIIKNGRLVFNSIKPGTTKKNKIVIKNGRIYNRLATSTAGYIHLVYSIATSTVAKILGVVRSSVEKVIGVE